MVKEIRIAQKIISHDQDNVRFSSAAACSCNQDKEGYEQGFGKFIALHSDVFRIFKALGGQFLGYLYFQCQLTESKLSVNYPFLPAGPNPPH